MRRFATIAFCISLLTILAHCGAGNAVQDSPSDPTAAGKPDAGRLPGPGTGVPAEQLDRIVELFNRGIGLMDRYEPRDAVEAFEEVTALAPRWTTGRLNLGIALLNVQEPLSLERAETELGQVLAEDPDSKRAHYALGMLFSHLARPDEARLHFEKVLEADPDDADAHYQLGILTVDRDPAAARRHLEKTLERIPHHESACYRLQGLLRRQGEREQAAELLRRFQELKASGAGVTSGIKYGEMGRYAWVVRAFDGPSPETLSNTAPEYADRAEQAGLTAAAAGRAGWPGEPDGGAASFGPGVTVADVDGDGDLDIYIPSLGAGGRGALYLSDGQRFSKASRTGIDGRNGIGAYFGDYDRDGDPDLYLTCDGPNRLYRNEGNGRFADVTQASGTAGGPYRSVGASWADADHDGDLDLYVANFSDAQTEVSGNAGAPNALWRNNGDGSFTDVAPAAGIDGGKSATLGVVFFDADDDRDLDLYLIDRGARNRLFLNHRIGRYSEGTSMFPELADAGSGLGAVLGDVDLNGREDLLLLRGKQPPRLFLQVERGRFVEDEAFRVLADKLGGAAGGLLGDLDLDGDLDLVLLDAGGGGKTCHRILMNDGTGGFPSPPSLLGEEREAPQARGAVAVDLDGDGALELLVARADAPPQLWHAAAPAERNWLEVIPIRSDREKPIRGEPGAIGLHVEVKTGRLLQVASITSSSGYLGGPPPQAHFGLGRSGKADYVRLSWPDAVLQSELEVSAGQTWRVTKVVRKPSSCPLLFSWDGQRFTFVTDFLGVGGIGFFVAPGIYAPPDPTEDVRIPPESIAPRDGRYLLRVAEPLEEVTYLDRLHLLAYDHPSRWEIYPDERFSSARPRLGGRPFALAEKIFPVRAVDRNERDVREQILEIDRRYLDPPIDERFEGYAEDHWIELDFGRQLRRFQPDDRLVLYLYGWTEYTFSHVNYAAHQAGVRMQPPRIEVPDRDGGWRVVAKAGYPAGLPRMMTLDVSSLPVREDGRLRIRSNMRISWDQIFVARDVWGPEIQIHKLRPAVAALRALGYPREFSPDGADPTLYDYDRRDAGIPFKNMSGNFTRFGDVRTLLQSVDDRFVIMGRGEEIALEFDAAELPALRPGWSRTLVLHTHGYCKDMDLYTAFPNTVEPLPFGGMKNYPPGGRPESVSLREYRRTWNTRRIVGY